MKKFLRSRWFIALLSCVVFIVTLVGLALKSKDLLLAGAVSDSDQAKQAAKELAKAKAKAPKKPETILEAANTEESVQHKQKKAGEERAIKGDFEVLNRITAPGDLQADNPHLRDLIQRLNKRAAYLDTRSAELDELEAHIKEQLKELHFHTNNIAMNGAQLDKKFENRVNIIRQNETNRLAQLANIYQNMLASSTSAEDRSATLRQVMQANQANDPTLNTKIFLYMAPTNQAAIFSVLTSGDAEDIKLYNDIIKNMQRTMVDPAIAPTP